MTNIKTMMEEMAQEELERDGAACREVMQSRKGAGAHGKMRLIDADALIFDLQHCGCVTVFGKMLVSAATHRINLQPTVDAVEVVRCEKCRWYKPPHFKADDGAEFPWDGVMRLEMERTDGIYYGGRCRHERNTAYGKTDMAHRELYDFCSYGKRRSGDE